MCLVYNTGGDHAPVKLITSLGPLTWGCFIVSQRPQDLLHDGPSHKSLARLQLVGIVLALVGLALLTLS